MKKIMLISSVILTIIVISIITINNRDKNEKNIIKSKEDEKEIVNSNMLTLMYETEAGSKEYVATKDNTWPEEGYIFNKNLSGCENGGELEYNSQNNTVNLLTNKSDKCYVYFDKYDGVWIDNVIATNITGSSITIDISATSENGSISKYYYQVNESGYIESTNNIITIEDLNKLTEYKIEVYAVDNTSAKSNIYELNVSTTDISIPIINSVVARDITYNSVNITINTTSENEIIRYYYIIDNDLSKISENNKYFVKGLMYNKEYKIFVFVEDIKGNYSEKYTLNFQTAKISLSNYIKELYIADGINNIYLHDRTGEYEDFEANDNSYRFTGGDYKKTSKAIGYNSIFGDLIKRQCGTNSNYSFYKNCLGYLEQYYYLDYDKNKTKYTNLNNIINQAKNDGYITDNIYNYICFGSEASTCPSKNLYRIIGIFNDKVKLIKADYVETSLLGTDGDYGIGYPSSSLYRGNVNGYIPGYFWNYENSSSTNKLWAESWLNTVNLNQNYVNNLGSFWTNKISYTNFKTGQISIELNYTPKQILDYETNTNNSYNAKIGLMYASDYGFASNPIEWNYTITKNDNYNLLENNWLFLGSTEWTILNTAELVGGFYATSVGIDYPGGYNSAAGLRPVFYLNSNIIYKSGSGTQSDPFRIE